MPLAMLVNCYLIHKTGMLANGYLIEGKNCSCHVYRTVSEFLVLKLDL